VTHIIVPGREVRGRCRVCRQPFFDGDSDFIVARHMQKCGQEFYERTHPQRSAIDRFLEEQDPEWGAYVRSGRHKPSTKPV
jgi:hypothetical protein